MAWKTRKLENRDSGEQAGGPMGRLDWLSQCVKRVFVCRPNCVLSTYERPAYKQLNYSHFLLNNNLDKTNEM